jgi:hypothetical protein
MRVPRVSKKSGVSGFCVRFTLGLPQKEKRCAVRGWRIRLKRSSEKGSVGEHGIKIWFGNYFAEGTNHATLKCEAVGTHLKRVLYSKVLEVLVKTWG